MATNIRSATNPDIGPGLTTDTLSIFREEVGITDISHSGPKSSKRRTARNIGIYRRVITAEKNARRQYYASATLINACLLLQIVFGSVLTALGAANGSHLVITGVGAANTVIAGLLSFTKGQGLPNKLMQYQNTMRKVREYIEQRERDFARPDCHLDLDRELQSIVEMYEAARKNDEANDPNAYHNDLDVSATSKLGAASNIAPSLPEDVRNMLGKLAATAGHQKRPEDIEKAEGLTEHQVDVSACSPRVSGLAERPRFCMGMPMNSLTGRRCRRWQKPCLLANTIGNADRLLRQWLSIPSSG